MYKRFYVGIALCGVFLRASAMCGKVAEPMTFQAIAERTKPVGVVAVSGAQAKVPTAQAALPPNAGEARYQSTCSVCHASGVAGAPRFRHAEDWKPRMAAGMEEMLAIAIKGKGAMPPKGTCMQCSDEELRLTIEYMLPQ